MLANTSLNWYLSFLLFSCPRRLFLFSCTHVSPTGPRSTLSVTLRIVSRKLPSHVPSRSTRAFPIGTSYLYGKPRAMFRLALFGNRKIIGLFRRKPSDVLIGSSVGVISRSWPVTGCWYSMMAARSYGKRMVSSVWIVPDILLMFIIF